MKQYPSYKDSGIDWIDHIPASWYTTKLKRICNIQGRIGFKGYTKDDLVSKDEGALTLGAKHISKSNKINLSDPEYISWEKYYESPEIMVKTGDVLVTQRGSLGKVAIIESEIGDATINPSMVLLNNLHINGKYLYYYLNSKYISSKVEIISSATAVPMISQEELGKFEILIPERSDQTAIANFLDHKTQQIDELIAKKQQLIELLKEERTAVINQAVTKGLDPTGPMKESGIEWLGEIPEHWDRVRLKHLVLIKITDGPHETPEFFEFGVPFLSAEAIRENVLDFDYARGYISEEQFDIYRRKSEAKRFDVLLCKSGSTTGKSAIVETDETFAIWSPLAIIRADQRKVLPYFIFHSLQSNKFRIQVEQFWSFGTQPNIGMGTIENLWIAVPPIPEQIEIVAQLNMKVKNIDQQIEMIIKEIELINEYKTSLINEAVTGKIDVRDYHVENIIV